MDSGSTDGSQEVAIQSGAMVIEHYQPGRFLITEQRNWALKYGGLRSEWVLFIDADEEISSDCRQAIQHAIRRESTPDGFELTPRYWFMGRWLRHTQGYPNWHPRLIQRGKLNFEGGVWESFAAGGKVGRITTPYEHYAFSKGIDDWLDRHIRYASWEAEQIITYLQTRDKEAIGTKRGLQLRILSSRVWPIRPLLRFLQKYVVQGGFREGWQGLLFALMMAMYDLITVVKVIEKKRQIAGKAL
ncbi:beta-glycosyltransferase/ family 2 [Synechococcus sp. MIT S9220]|nr:beta-glycosyltransferase/ family 2 [Synechococcus sp. MIT S9220]